MMMMSNGSDEERVGLMKELDDEGEIDPIEGVSKK